MRTTVRTGRLGTLVVAGTVISLAFLISGCGGAPAGGAGWTFGPTLAPAATSTSPASAVPSQATPSQAAASPVPASPAATPVPASPSATSSPVLSTPGPGETPKAFSGRMTPQVILHDGYVSMYMDLENTGSEPLTFLNTLYDIEPDKLYAPVVDFPWTTGETAVYTRQGRFFPSPAIVQPGDRAVYVMGGMEARGNGQLAQPVANIKFCPTRGMDDTPSLPVQVDGVTWSTTGGVTSVSGTLVQTSGPQRVDPPVVAVAFFDASGAFVGAVVGSRVGDHLVPGEVTPFAIEGRGVETDRIVRAEAYAFVS